MRWLASIVLLASLLGASDRAWAADADSSDARATRDRSEEGSDEIPVPTRPRPGADASLADLISSLRARGPVDPSRGDALLREEIVREALAMPRHLPIPRTARAAYDRATHPPRRAKVDPLRELKTALLEAPWWAEAYREIAALEEKAGNLESAIVSLELYLVGKPDAKDWKAVRRRMWRMTAELGGSQ